MTPYIGVVHLKQVTIARAEGFVSFSHGRERAVRRLVPGDRVIYYAPRDDKDGRPVRAFVAHAEVTGETVETRDFGAYGIGHIRRARFDDVVEVPVHDIREAVSFIPEGRHWGVAFRNGQFRISPQDYQALAGALLGGAR